MTLLAISYVFTQVIRQSQQLRPSHLQALGAGGGGKKKRRRRKRQQESDAVKSALAFPVTGSGSDGEDGADGAGLDVVTVIGSSKGERNLVYRWSLGCRGSFCV